MPGPSGVTLIPVAAEGFEDSVDDKAGIATKARCQLISLGHGDIKLRRHQVQIMAQAFLDGLFNAEIQKTRVGPRAAAESGHAELALSTRA